MIPLHDNVPTRRFPIVCVLLIGANVIAYVLDHYVFAQQVVQQVLYPDGIHEVVQYVGGLSARYSMVPANITSGVPGSLATVFTSMFLHASLMHIGFNMWFLWIFGNNVEDVLGRFRFVLFYFACGIAAAALYIATAPQSAVPTIGASGAIAGLMGAYLILFPRAQILSIVPIFFIGMLMEVPAVLVIGFWALLQFANASWFGGGDLQGGGVAYFAHIGGFLGGMLLILLLGGRRLVDRRREQMRPDIDYWR